MAGPSGILVSGGGLEELLEPVGSERGPPVGGGGVCRLFHDADPSPPADTYTRGDIGGSHVHRGPGSPTYGTAIHQHAGSFPHTVADSCPGPNVYANADTHTSPCSHPFTHSVARRGDGGASRSTQTGPA